MEQEDYDLQDYLENVVKYRTFTGLKTYFESRYKKSLDKDTFLKREIEGYDLVFEESKLPLSCEIEDSECQPLFNYSIQIYDWEIILLRNAYDNFIVKGNDLSEAEYWEKKMISMMPQKLPATYFIDLAKELIKYQMWVKEYSVPRSKYPDKYYAWYHKILIAKGKAEQFTPGARQEIIDYGKTRYGTKGHGFYQSYMSFNLTTRQSFVDSLSPKDRKAWKGIIIEISNNNSDIINYLKEFPN